MTDTTAPIWQDIATAPKDGHRILAFTTTKGNTALTQYLCDVGDMEIVEYIQIVSWCGDMGEWEKEKIGEPTHWQPLPAPPTA